MACYQPDAIFVVPRSGQPRCLLHDWTGQLLSRASNVAIAGVHLSTLVVANLGGLHLIRLDPGVSGAVIARPDSRSRLPICEQNVALGNDFAGSLLA